jgi:hypothetical protein
MAISSILRSFGKFCIFYGHLVYIYPFWYVVPRKIWQPRHVYLGLLMCAKLGKKWWPGGAAQWSSHPPKENPGSYPARVYGFKGKQSKADL